MTIRPSLMELHIQTLENGAFECNHCCRSTADICAWGHGKESIYVIEWKRGPKLLVATNLHIKDMSGCFCAGFNQGHLPSLTDLIGVYLCPDCSAYTRNIYKWRSNWTDMTWPSCRGLRPSQCHLKLRYWCLNFTLIAISPLPSENTREVCNKYWLTS